MRLVAKNPQSQLAGGGELTKGRLTAFWDDGDGLLRSLAPRWPAARRTSKPKRLKRFFTSAGNAEAAAEEFLVGDGWKPGEVEPETVGVNGNGYPETMGIGPIVEPVPVSGHNSKRDHDDEQQQTQFCPAEFMVKEPGPVMPEGRKHTLSPPPSRCSSGPSSRSSRQSARNGSAH